MTIGVPLVPSTQSTTVVLYSVNQAGQLKLMDQFSFFDQIASSLQVKQMSKEQVMILDPESSSVKALDVEKERVSNIVFDQIISEKLRTLRPLKQDSLLLTTASNSIFLVTF